MVFHFYSNNKNQIIPTILPYCVFIQKQVQMFLAERRDATDAGRGKVAVTS